MASANKNLSAHDNAELPSAKDMSFGIVVADWNEHITHALLKGCKELLLQQGADESRMEILHVPGSYELPFGAKLLLSAHKLDAIICLGCVIKGETKHDQYISQAVAGGIMQLGLMTDKPVIFGVLTPNNDEQARDRAGGKHGNKGVEAAVTALQMVALARQTRHSERKIGF
jgi:6,7-dimethyl-8-ribityllumazine synthase